MAGINDPYSDPPVVIEHTTVNPVVERSTTYVETEDKSWGPWAITFILGVVALVAIFAYFMISNNTTSNAASPAIVEHSTTRIEHDGGGRAQPIIVNTPATHPTINVTPPATNSTVNVTTPASPDPDNNATDDTNSSSNSSEPSSTPKDNPPSNPDNSSTGQ